MRSAPPKVFRAWTRHLDRWLAAPGTLLMRPEVDSAFYFETHHGREQHPYYGRIIELTPDRRLQMTWLSTGTKHRETLLTIDLAPEGEGTYLRLTHEGFPDAESRDAHEQGWPPILELLDESLEQIEIGAERQGDENAHR